MQKPFPLASIACHKFCPKEAVKAVLLVRDRGDKSLQQNRPLTKKGDAGVFLTGLLDVFDSRFVRWWEKG